MRYNLLIEIEEHGIHSTAVKEISYNELCEEFNTFPVQETFFTRKEETNSIVRALVTALKKQWEKIIGYKEVHIVSLAFSKGMKESLIASNLYGEELVATLKEWFGKEKLYELKRAEYRLMDAEYAFVKGAICRNDLIYQNIIGFYIGNNLLMIQIKEGRLVQDSVKTIKCEVLTQLTQKYYGMELSSLELCKRAEQGNKNAIDCLNEFGQIVLKTVQDAIGQSSTDAVILGGRMLKSQRFFLNLLLNYINDRGIDVVTERNMTQTVFHGLISDNERQA